MGAETDAWRWRGKCGQGFRGVSTEGYTTLGDSFGSLQLNLRGAPIWELSPIP